MFWRRWCEERTWRWPSASISSGTGGGTALRGISYGGRISSARSSIEVSGFEFYARFKVFSELCLLLDTYGWILFLNQSYIERFVMNG